MINIVNRTFSLLGVVLISVLRLVSIARSFYFFHFSPLYSSNFYLLSVFLCQPSSKVYCMFAWPLCAVPLTSGWDYFQFSLPPRYSLQPVILRVSFLLGVGISVRYSYSLHLLGCISLVRNISRNSSSPLSFCWCLSSAWLPSWEAQV